MRLKSKILALELNIQTVTALNNYSSFTYCIQILTSSNSCMYRCYELCDMDNYMKPVGCITKPVTHLNWDRIASCWSIFVKHFSCAFWWRFFLSWIASLVNCNRIDSWVSTFVWHFPCAFWWRFFLAWIDSLANRNRIDSGTSTFVGYLPCAFWWRFFFAWIARTVKWKSRTSNFTCTDMALQ